MGDLALMIKNMLDMSCEHIAKGFITKEFAGNAMESFIKGLFFTEGDEKSVKQLNQMLDYWSKWCRVYIENINVEVKK